MAGVLGSLLASFGETTDSTLWPPSVTPQIVPAVLDVPCAIDSLSAETCKVYADAWFL